MLHGYTRLVMWLYFRQIKINKPECLQLQGPLLIAANHPNSFLDGIILSALFRQPVFSLARGDAFANKWFSRVLRWLHMLPVYRTTEGTENLLHNYTTFAACRKTFEEKGIVLIFSEAACCNEWRLRPLRKGTARLAISSWQEGLDLKVLPLGFNYSSFRSFGKNVVLNFGVPINKAPVLMEEPGGRQLLQFNAQLQLQLQDLVYDINPADRGLLEKKLGVPAPNWQKWLLILPGFAGWILHAPLYYPVKLLARRAFNNDHYDSVQAALLLLCYPLYLLLAGWIGIRWWHPATVLLALLCMPLTARALLLLKEQFPGMKKANPGSAL